MANIILKKKDTIGEAAESMREPWEKYRAEQAKLDRVTYSGAAWEARAIRFVAQIMPDSNAGTIMAVARRLVKG